MPNNSVDSFLPSNFFDLIDFYRKNPIIAAEELMEVNLTASPIQQVIFEAMWFKSNVLAIVSRGGGKTFVQAAHALLKALLYPGHRVGLIAPAFRQAKVIFQECERIWERSDLLQACTLQKPTYQSDNCFIKFKPASGFASSVIQALPLGDGSKIRGARFYTIACDEFPHIPPEIFNLVIRPMAATKANPIEQVERAKRRKVLEDMGLADQIDKEDNMNNQILITSSGYFTFNHMYDLYNSYKSEEEKGNPRYATFRVPYTLIPEGFLDEENIADAKKNMSSLEFEMEYCASFIPDTDGLYKASLLQRCRSSNCEILLAGSPGKAYVLGVDPARTEDSFAIVVFELGHPCKNVAAFQFKGMPFPEMARTIEHLANIFNVSLIYMDSGGGGHAIRDILAENNSGYSQGPILDIEDEQSLHKHGRRILRTIPFTTDFISDSNMVALRMLEHGQIQFPALPPVGDDRDLETKEEYWSNINQMLHQMQLITITETRTGKLHFDVPKGEGHKAQKKDLYTAFMLAARASYDSLFVEESKDVLVQSGKVNLRMGSSSKSDVSQVLPGSIHEKILLNDPAKYQQEMLRAAFSTSRKIITSNSAVLKPLLVKKK